MRRSLILVDALLVAVWLTGSGVGHAAGVSRIEVAPRVLDVGAGYDVRIRFYVAKPARVMMRVFDDHQSQVWSKTEAFQRGYGQMFWDGRGRNGKLVGAGVYTVVLDTDVGIRPGEDSYVGARAVAVYDLVLDRTTGLVTYRLPEPASVQVRLGMKDGGPLLRTIVALQGPGGQAVRWDGWDDSRVVNLLDDPNMVASVRAVALPENSIIVRDGKTLDDRSPASFHLELGQRIHADATGTRNTLVATVQVAGAVLGDGRYEWVFFVDGRFVFEEEKLVTNPYVFELDTTPLAEGEHFLTVNLTGQRDDLVQSVSDRFQVKR